MNIFHDFLLTADARSIDRRGVLRVQKVLRKDSSLDPFDLSSYYLYQHKYGTERSLETHHHHFIRRLASNTTNFDETEQGSPTTVAIVSTVLFLLIISVFFLLSCVMWCFSSSGCVSVMHEECS
jgi:hypothetical protein